MWAEKVMWKLTNTKAVSKDIASHEVSITQINALTPLLCTHGLAASRHSASSHQSTPGDNFDQQHDIAKALVSDDNFSYFSWKPYVVPLIWTVSSIRFRWGVTTYIFMQNYRKLSLIITKYTLLSRALYSCLKSIMLKVTSHWTAYKNQDHYVGKCLSNG